MHWFQKCYSFRSTTKSNKVIVEKQWRHQAIVNAWPSWIDACRQYILLVHIVLITMSDVYRHYVLPVDVLLVWLCENLFFVGFYDVDGWTFSSLTLLVWRWERHTACKRTRLLILHQWWWWRYDWSLHNLKLQFSPLPTSSIWCYSKNQRTVWHSSTGFTRLSWKLAVKTSVLYVCFCVDGLLVASVSTHTGGSVWCGYSLIIFSRVWALLVVNVSIALNNIKTFLRWS